MAIEWSIGDKRIVSLKTDAIYSIAFDRIDLVDDTPVVFCKLSVDDKVVMVDSFEQCRDEAERLAVKTMNEVQKFEAYLQHLEDCVEDGKHVFNYKWVDKTGGQLTLSYVDMLHILELAKKGAKHE